MNSTGSRDEMREKLCNLYRDSHNYPELKALKWPADFADEAMQAVDQYTTQQLTAVLDTVQEDVIGPDYHFTDDAFPTVEEKVRLESMNRLLESQRRRLTTLRQQYKIIDGETE